jgi:hypothetical protein
MGEEKEEHRVISASMRPRTVNSASDKKPTRSSTLSAGSVTFRSNAVAGWAFFPIRTVDCAQIRAYATFAVMVFPQ